MIQVKHYPEFSDKEFDTACEVLTGIFDACCAGQYVKGVRNDMAVDFTIACHVLHLDTDTVIGMINMDKSSRDNLRARVKVCNDYVKRWETAAHNTSLGSIWDYALQENNWIDWFNNTEVHSINLIKL